MKIFRTQNIILLSILVVILNSSCKTRHSITNENFAPLYSEEEVTLASDIRIRHLNSSETEVSLNINCNELLFVRENAGAPFFADIKISLMAFDTKDIKNTLDTISGIHKIAKDSVHSDLMKFSIILNIETGKNAFLRIDITDINKSRRETHTATITKSNTYGNQWFSISGETDEHFNYYSYSPGDTVVLEYLGDGKDSLQVYFYADSFEIPDPPFSFENLVALKLDEDSVYKPLGIDSKRLTFIVPEKGLYFVSADPEKKSGYSVFCTRKHYPLITSASDMILPTRYICSKKEFISMLENSSPKDAIDKFWLNIGGYEKRAGILIKNYYSRVIQANRLFTAHTEGWKSDRGMIYIVFGLPNIVYRDSNSETWIYGEDKNFYSITFTFKKVENKFSDNDYFLIRTPVYKDNWYRAVDIWRQ